MTAPADTGCLVIVGCSRRKTETAVPIPALELYQGGAVPRLRALVAHCPERRSRVRIISAQHGLLHPDTPLLPYDRAMDPQRALALRRRTAADLRELCAREGVPNSVLVLAEPLYLLALADLPDLVGPDAITYLTDPAADWPAADAILATWSWRCP
jgi:hypothetical protein